MSTPRVKICGVTRPGDAMLAAELGAAAIGLMFWPASPRAVTIDRAKEIVQALPPFVAAVGVFVDEPMEHMLRVADAVGLTALQLHGDEPPSAYVAAPRRIIKAIPVGSRDALERAAAVPASAMVLLDAHDPVKRGGTGRTIDWTIAASVARRRPVILSGGLSADNVAQAVQAVTPSGIDVSSGVESAPGRKDPAKLRSLFEALRSA